MIGDKPYRQTWRPVYELWSAAVWLLAIVSSLFLSLFSPLPTAGFQISVSLCVIMLIVRLIQALPRWQQHGRLNGKPITALTLNDRQCRKLHQRTLKNGLWLGWGFEWQRQHGQQAWDLLRSDNLPAKSEDRMGASWIHGLAAHEQALYQPLDQAQMHTLVIGVPAVAKPACLIFW